MNEFIIKLIKLIRPAFYNKITWIVVIAGLALIATPFWEEILFAGVKKEYNLDLAPGGNTTWGFALVIVGLTYPLTSNYLLKFIEYRSRKSKDKKRRAHEVAIFMKSQEILSEKSLLSFIEWLFTDHSIRSNDSAKVHEFATYHLMLQNEYIDEELQNSAKEVSKNLLVLLEWMTLNFFVYPETQTGEYIKLCMHPNWNVDRGGHGDPEDLKKYDEAAEKLRELSNNVTRSYKNYRQAMKL